LPEKIATQSFPIDGAKLMKQKTVARQYDGQRVKPVSQKALNK